ncbi:hypothetical protein, partial [Neisseria sicca]|uniref:hypothetical protein n=1 Tax=Neisseria sicca TaxID=490 RepID=UPI001C993448
SISHTSNPLIFITPYPLQTSSQTLLNPTPTIYFTPTPSPTSIFFLPPNFTNTHTHTLHTILPNK